MSFTNINDPAGVSALLEQLRSSQAWADLQAQKPSDIPPQPQPIPPQEQPEDLPETKEATPSVASLLSQLSSSVTGPSPVPTLRGTITTSSPSFSAPSPLSVMRPKKDVRNFTLQQALPYLAQLSDDPAFVEAISNLRHDQAATEKRLWEEREALQYKQAEKVKIAITKANMLGTGISEREARVMRQVFEKELTKFDQERVMTAWNGLVARQQAELEKLNVPAMFTTNEGQDRERQQRIIQVMEGILGSGED